MNLAPADAIIREARRGYDLVVLGVSRRPGETLFFGDTVSTSQVLELCRDVLAEGLSHARDGADWAKLVAPVERAARRVESI